MENCLFMCQYLSVLRFTCHVFFFVFLFKTPFHRWCLSFIKETTGLKFQHWPAAKPWQREWIYPCWTFVFLDLGSNTLHVHTISPRLLDMPILETNCSLNIFQFLVNQLLCDVLLDDLVHLCENFVEGDELYKIQIFMNLTKPTEKNLEFPRLYFTTSESPNSFSLSSLVFAIINFSKKGHWVSAFEILLVFLCFVFWMLHAYSPTCRWLG